MSDALRPPVDKENNCFLICLLLRLFSLLKNDSWLIFLTFLFSPGIEAVRARWGFGSEAPAFVTAGVLTSIVFRLKILGDLLRVYLSRLSSLQKWFGSDLEIHWNRHRLRLIALSENGWKKCQYNILVTLLDNSPQKETRMWFKSISERKTTGIDVFTAPTGDTLASIFMTGGCVWCQQQRGSSKYSLDR